MNEYITRLAIIAVCIIIAAAAAAYIIFGLSGNKKPENSESGELSTSISAEEKETETAASPKAEETEYVFDENDVTDAPEVTIVPEDKNEESGTSKTRTIITSRVRKDYDSNSVYIDMENILQLPELPVGCEITALTIMLRHLGFDADKQELARSYLPKGGNAQYIDGELYKDSFFDYFIGDPFSRGYGCFSNAIEKAANRYIEDNGGGYDVINISGAHPDVLYDYLAAGVPVICWATDGMIEPEYYETWRTNDSGEEIYWYLNEHCFVLAGFNMSAGLVTLNDPMKGIIDYNINRFETRYNQMYRQAIVIMKSEESFIPSSYYEHDDENYSSPLWTEEHIRTETTTAETEQEPHETEETPAEASNEEPEQLIFV